MANIIITIHLCHTKIPGIIYFFYTQHRNRGINDLLNIIISNGITQYDQHFLGTYYLPGEIYGMAGTIAFVLLYKTTVQVRVVLIYIILDLLSQVTNNKNIFFIDE